MRATVLLLILVNVLLFGYARLDRAAQSEGARLREQVQPDRIRVLSSRQVAALGPAKMAALPDVCVEWGPFSDAERGRAQAELEPLQLGRLLSTRPFSPDATYWVNTGPTTNRGAAERRAADLRAQSIDDLSVVDVGRGQFTVSLGIFRTESAANTRAESMTARGVQGVRVEARQGGIVQTLLVVRDPPQSAVVRMKELQLSYPGTELKVGPCTAAS